LYVHTEVPTLHPRLPEQQSAKMQLLPQPPLFWPAYAVHVHPEGHSEEEPRLPPQ